MVKKKSRGSQPTQVHLENQQKGHPTHGMLLHVV